MTEPARAALFTFPERPEDRLRRALRSLEAALGEQARAVSELRQELGALSGSLGGLEDAFDGYSVALARSGTECRTAEAEFRKLEGTADMLLALARR
jgi:hypothetical protein